MGVACSYSLAPDTYFNAKVFTNCTILFLFSRYFCAYVALAITFSYMMIITFFVAAMTFDVRRINGGRRDCLPICLAPQPKNGEAFWDEPSPQLSNRLMKGWANFLIFPVTKGFVLLMSVTLFGLGIYGTTKVTERLVFTR